MTRHARLAADRRGLSRSDIRRAVGHPYTVSPGRRAGTERRLAEIGGRTVVAIVAPQRRVFRVLTVYCLGEDRRPGLSIS